MSLLPPRYKACALRHHCAPKKRGGPDGLYNRSSQPESCPHAIDDLRQQRIIELRKQRQTYRHINQSLGIGHSSVARILQRMGLNRLANLEPAPSSTTL